MAALSPHDALAALTAFGRRLPTTAARAVGVGGGAPVFSGTVAPKACEGRRESGFPIRLRDDAWAERAALLEFDGGWPRAQAEAIADRLIAMDAEGASPGDWAAFEAELITLERQRAPWPSE